MAMCGGLGSASDMTDEVKAICDNLREDIEKQAGKKFSIFTPKSYRSQVVAGTNFFVKIAVEEGGEHVHVRIFQPLPHTKESPSVKSCQAGHTADSPIEYFG